jgi:TRAP transporter TAXI family solute receptor
LENIMNKLKLAISSTLLIMLPLLGHTADTNKARSYILSTASTGGTYYPVGVAVATLAKVKLAPKHKLSLSAITSAGSGDNLNLMRKNEAQFGILQGLYGAWAWNGTGPFKSQGANKEFRSVTMLWKNVEHFTVKKDAVKGNNLTDISSLYDKSFSIGKKNSGTEGSGKHILGSLGINTSKLNTVHMGYGASAGAMQDNRIEGMNTPAGIPVSAVTRAFSSDGENLKVLNISDASLKKINKEFPLWVRQIIPANTYPNQKEQINTIAQPNFLAVKADLPEHDVYLVTKAIYENLPFLRSIHSATKVMSIENAISGLTVPLHPGAARYYREVGVKIPAHLVSK